jgi:predicted TIM-barrel fold metal-dependent hydrolase
MIWDLHCHMTFLEGTPEERVAQIMEYADRVGIDRFVFYLGYPTDNNPNPDLMRRQNDQVMQGISHWHDRAVGFVYLNPNYVEESLQEFDRCVVNGPFVGIKFLVAKRCSDPAIDPIIERAKELDVPVFQHTWYNTLGNRPGESSPDDVAILAARHPTAKLICGHSGGNWEKGIRAIRKFPNVSIGISGSDPTVGLVEMGVRELGAERILYGTDFGGRSMSSQLSKVRGATISDADKELIFGLNLKRLLQPILDKKGIVL